VGLVEEFDIDYQGVILDGVREVASIDTEYRQGIQAFKVEFRANNNLIATRWYQIAGSVWRRPLDDRVASRLVDADQKSMS